MVWRVSPTKTYGGCTKAFTEMEATCQDDRGALNCFKRGNMHMRYAEEWSAVVGGGGWVDGEREEVAVVRGVGRGGVIFVTTETHTHTLKQTGAMSQHAA